MQTSGFTARPEVLRSVARDLDSVGSELAKHAKEIKQLDLHDPGVVFNQGVPASARLGKQYNDILHMLAAYGDHLGRELDNCGQQLSQIAANYARNDEAKA